MEELINSSQPPPPAYVPRVGLMAVTAPTLESTPSTLAARAPVVTNGHASDSDDDDQPLARKPNWGAKRAVGSDSDDDVPLVGLRVVQEEL